MSKSDIDFRTSSSAIDAFFEPERPANSKVASRSGKTRIASLSALAGFERVAGDTLVHVSQQDFWKLGQDDEGFFIERLVDDSSAPVKG